MITHSHCQVSQTSARKGRPEPGKARHDQDHGQGLTSYDQESVKATHVRARTRPGQTSTGTYKVRAGMAKKNELALATQPGQKWIGL